MKSSISNSQSNIKKTSTRKSSVKIKSETTELDDMESLVALNNQKERKKLDGIDERIKFLKSELRSLLGDTKPDGNCVSFPDNRSSKSMLQFDKKRPKDLKTSIKAAENQKDLKQPQMSGTVQFKPNSNSTQSKFSEWLDKTIDEMDTKSEHNAHTVTSNIKAHIDLTCETDAPYSSSGLLLSQENVEQLLYRSFLMQNSDMYLCNSEASDAELHRSTDKTRQQKCKKSQKKGKKGNSVQISSRPTRRNTRKGERRRIHETYNEVEVINLDSSSASNNNPECVDLDMSNYDWSEPFDINKESQLDSDVQVLECSAVKSHHLKYNQIQSPSPEVTVSDIHLDEWDKIQSKKAWECPVCFHTSKGQEIVATQCGHIFCRKCLENHITKLSNNCPSCRCDLRDKPFITLFNF